MHDGILLNFESHTHTSRAPNLPRRTFSTGAHRFPFAHLTPLLLRTELQADPYNRYLFVRDPQSTSLPSTLPRQHAQVFQRKWDLGIVFEAQLHDTSAGTGRPKALSYDMLRAAAGEFIGTLLFLFNGKLPMWPRRWQDDYCQLLTLLEFYYILIIVFLVQTEKRRARSDRGSRKSSRQSEDRRASRLPYSFLRRGSNTSPTPTSRRSDYFHV